MSQNPQWSSDTATSPKRPSAPASSSNWLSKTVTMTWAPDAAACSHSPNVAGSLSHDRPSANAKNRTPPTPARSSQRPRVSTGESRYGSTQQAATRRPGQAEALSAAYRLS